MAQLAEELRSLGMTVETDVRCDQNAMPISVRSTLHRVLQEATTNVAKHAGEGARVCIELRDAGPDVVLEVENTVTERSGPPQWNSSGVGLNSMRDRVATFGGTIEAGPGAGGGGCARCSPGPSDEADAVAAADQTHVTCITSGPESLHLPPLSGAPSSLLEWVMPH